MIFQPELLKSLEAHGNRVAIETGQRSVSYASLLNTANAITAHLLNRQLPRENIVGILLEDRPEIISAMIGVMNARCVFVLLDGTLPDERLDSMLKTLNLQHMIVRRKTMQNDGSKIWKTVETFFWEDIFAGGEKAPESIRYPEYDGGDSLYVYFTSGSTGVPKGIVGKNCSLLQFLRWEIHTFGINENSRFSQFISPYFDAFLRDVFAPLLAGATICIPTDEVIVPWIDETRITVIHCVPSLFRVINTGTLSPESFKHLRYVLMSGEKIIPAELVSWYRIFNDRIKLVNFYGTTETTMIRSYHEISPEDVNLPRIPIGMPIWDTELLVADDGFKPCDTLVTGELYIISEYVTKGYLNAPELTSKKFLRPGFLQGEKIAFRTGDKARILANGKIELLGREDRQVKLRGIRVELDEIESVLVRSDLVRNAAVIKHTDEGENESLIAFVILKDPGASPALKGHLQQHLEKHLPKYIMPADVIAVSEYPLLGNGKINYNALLKLAAPEREIVPPANETEARILSIWNEILGDKPVSTTDSFNKAGGHSLSMMNLISKIDREFNVKLSLSQLFENLTVREQAELVLNADKDVFVMIPEAPAADHYKLSSAQKRLYFLYEFERTSLAYNMPQAVMLEGALEEEKLNTAFSRLISRHESLRTYFEVVNEEPVQKIAARVPFAIEQLHSSEAEPHETIRKFIRPFDLGTPPLLRAGLIRTSETSHILVVDMHHIIADGASQAVLIKDFMAFYHNESLPELKLHYKDYAEWQQHESQQKTISRQREFWINAFKGAIPKPGLPTDYPRRDAKKPDAGAAHFEISGPEVVKLRSIAESEGATMFMVTLAVCNILVSRLSNQQDIVIGTSLAGRHHDGLENIIGMFVNTLPLRNRVRGDLSFKALLASVRSNALSFLANQDYPYEELIDALNVERDTHRNPLFDILLAYQNFKITALAIPGLELKPLEWQKPEAKFDITFFAFEVDDKIVIHVEYAAHLFRKETIDRFIGYFKRIVSAVTTAPGSRISDIDIISENEKNLLLHTFNRPRQHAPAHDTLVSLFERQVLHVPEKTALHFNGVSFTYRELNERANQLAHRLKEGHGLGGGDLAGVMIEKSENMIIGLIAVLKTGAAFVPVSSDHPHESIAYILQNSNARLLLVNDATAGKHDHGISIVNVDGHLSGDSSSPENMPNAGDRCCVLYTPGPGGYPIGAMVTHANVAAMLTALDQLPRDEESCMLASSSITADTMVTELLWPLCRGIEIVLPPPGISLNALNRNASSGDEAVDFSLFFFSSYDNREQDRYRLLLDSVKSADQKGFTAVWTPERHFHEFGGLYPNPSVTSAALAMVTDKIELRCGSIVSPLHDPIRIAEEWAVVDNLSGGRVGMSFGSGWNVNDFALADGNFQERQKVMYDQIALIKKLWKGEKVKRVNGVGNEIEIGVFPRPVQKELPVWITSSRSEETFKSAGAIGANILTHLLGQDLEELARKIRIYREARQQHGYDAHKGKVTVMLHAYVGDDIHEVEKIVERPFMEYLKSAIGLDKIMMEEAGLKEEEVSEEDRQTILKNAFIRYYKTASLIGTKASCREMVQRLRWIGVDEIACLVDFGIEKDVVLQGLENLDELRALFAKARTNTPKPVTMLQVSTSSGNLDSTGFSNLLGSLRLLLIKGQSLPASLINKLKEHRRLKAYTLYGAPQTTALSALHEVGEPSRKTIIGRPVLNVQAYILDESLKLLPTGTAGDLYIGGAGVSAGYLNSPELTAEHFITTPLIPGEKLYRTGDVARWLPDGNLEGVRHKDSQRGPDRNVLQDIAHHPADGNDLRSSEIEKKLIDIWAEVLKTDRSNITAGSNFFKLNGHSLRALVMINKVFKELKVKVPLKEFFGDSTIQGLRKFIQTARTSDYAPIQSAGNKRHYPVSDSQRAMYLLYEFDKASLFYNQPRVMRIDGPLDTKRLEDAFDRIIARHEVLRTSFEVIDDEPVQRVWNEVDFSIAHFSATENEVKAIVESIIRPFDLEQVPLLRVGLIEVGPTRHYLVIDTHHIIIDGTSDGIFMKELAALYDGLHLQELKLQYKDYASWQHSDAHRREIEKQKDFWMNQFADEVPALELPVDFAEPVAGYSGSTADFSISGEEIDALKSVTGSEGTSTFMLILAVYNILLSRLANQEDILVGTLVSGREHADVENMLGMFVAALPLRNRLNGDLTFREFLREVKANTLLSFENQAYQYSAQVLEPYTARNAKRIAPFNAFYAFRNFERHTYHEIERLSFEHIHAGGIGESRYDINLVAAEQEREITLTLACGRLFKKETCERFARYFAQIVKNITQHPDIRISEIEIITNAEKQQVLKDFNNTRKKVNADRSFSALFEAQVKRTPLKTAVEHNGKRLTYQELHERSVQWSSVLTDHGIRANSKTALYLPRGIDMLASMLAVFHAGGAYVPIDVEYPAERVKEILTDSEAGVILTSREVAHQLADIKDLLPGNRQLLVVDDWTDLKTPRRSRKGKRHNPEDLAYVIYTSGTSGKPKGVMIHQAGMINHLYAKINDLGLGERDVVAQTASACFDISVWQFLAGLLTGGKTLIIDKEKVMEPEWLIKTLQRGAVTVFESVPSLMIALLDGLRDDQNKTLPDLRWMISTGEPLNVALAKKWFSSFPDIRLLNAYGPTEASDDVTHHIVKIPAEEQSVIPVGKPVQNIRIYILDRYQHLCPVGVKGEIYIAGLGVGKGYWKNEAKTKKAFIQNPFAANDPYGSDYATLFRTGDMGYYLENGDIICMGRADEQVKIRGFRIELGEIESVLMENENVKEAVAVTYNKEAGNTKLAAFVVPANASVSTVTIKQMLRSRLPDYMIPSSLIKIDKMPLTANGKVDKKALLNKLALLEQVEENYIEPRTEVEKQLAQVWKEVLGIDTVGLNDTFFDLGGHSLLLIRNNQRIKKQFNVELPFRLYFTHTLEQIAKAIASAHAASPEVDALIETTNESAVG